MYAAPVMWGDDITPPRLWPCNEVAYVAAKSTDPVVRRQVLEVYEGKLAPWPAGPGGVKKFGRTIALRPDWEDVKIPVMTALVLDKFTRNSELRRRLLATGNAEIREGNRWGDTFWGVALEDNLRRGVKAGDGRNELGRIIMRIRDDLRATARSSTPSDSRSHVASLPSVTGVVNLKAIRKSARDPLPDDVLDCSRYGKVAFVDGTRLGNRFVMTEHGGRDGSREDVIRKHAQELSNHLKKPGFAEWLARAASGKRLGCFCKPAACHCDTIMAAANAVIAGRDPQEAIKPFLSLGLADADRRTLAPGRNAGGSSPPCYAGIGSRDTPAEVLAKMRDIGRLLAEAGWTLRSGGADGADINFERGCDDAGGSKKIYIPWESFEAKKELAATGYRPARPAGTVHIGVSPAAIELAKQHHPAWSRLGGPAQKLMGRNGYQILDVDLKTPVDAVICWTKDGLLQGGTSQALRLAAAHGIDPINLGADRWRQATAQEIVTAVTSRVIHKDASRSTDTIGVPEPQAGPSTGTARQSASRNAPDPDRIPGAKTSSTVAPIRNSLLMR